MLVVCLIPELNSWQNERIFCRSPLRKILNILSIELYWKISNNRWIGRWQWLFKQLNWILSISVEFICWFEIINFHLWIELALFNVIFVSLRFRFLKKCVHMFFQFFVWEMWVCVVYLKIILIKYSWTPTFDSLHWQIRFLYFA